MAKSDLISRADVVHLLVERYKFTTSEATEILSALPSADAVSREDYEKIKNMVSTQFQTVLEDYLELEKRYVALLGKQSQKPSAEAVQGWIPFTRRPMTEEEQKDYPNCTFMFDCVLPYDGDEILVSNGRFVWMDTFCSDIDGCYLDSGDDIDEDMAWMPLPKPYKGGEK